MRSKPPGLIALTALLHVASVALGDVPAEEQTDPAAQRQQLAFFEERVRPVLVEHCYECHAQDSDRLEGGLLLDRREGHLTGGDSGPAITPGDPDASLLIEAVRYESYEMPPKGKLPDRDIKSLEEWVAMGAPWPAEPDANAGAGGAREVFNLEQRRSEHWAWRPIEDPRPPEVSDEPWPLNDADRFVLRRLEEAGLAPAGDVDRTGLLRRACFDLTGLPPTLPQVSRFLNDEKPGAFARVVDELLASPHFGERWGRHWLDLVRYAESRGHEFDGDAPNAHQYRDYVIRALNADVPYDQFIREHLAGDLLLEPRLHPEQRFNESILGTGFWHLGEWVHSPVDTRRDEADRFDNMIDVMSKTFLGVTVACARCHDHKFDAVSTEDYYALSGFLQSSDYRQVRFESLEHNRRVAERLNALDRDYRRRVLDFLAEAGLSEAPAPPAPLRPAGVLVDYAALPPDGFLQDGFSFGEGPRLVGDPYLVATEDGPEVRFSPRTVAVNDPAWHGLKSITEGASSEKPFSRLEGLPRSGRTLRTPTFELSEGIVHCRIQGRGHVVACVDSHRTISGPLHGQTIRPTDPKSPWTRINLTRYVGHRLHLEFVPAEEESLGVSLVLQGASEADLRAVEEAERTAADRVDRLAESLSEHLAADEAARRAYTKLVLDWSDSRRAIRREVRRESRLAMAMLDGTGEDGRVLIRGNASKPGDVAPRRFLAALDGDQPMRISAGSGRLLLAARINDPSNPLTTRVIVNRVWHHLMGRGIVATTDDFGVLGQRPTHPGLLDHLASRFTANGQSLKETIRYLMLSRTYRMSSHASAEARESDPNNLLWSHRPPKRLQGEAIRDALLAVSGRLDRKLYGPPVPIHLTPFMTGLGRPKQDGPLDGDGRRSIYTAVRRNFLSPFMLTFDTPTPFSSMGRRNTSNVPAQSLILMNDPLVMKLASDWSARVLGTVPDDPGNRPSRLRVRSLYLTGFGREPTAEETQIALDFVQEQAADRGVAIHDAAVWADLAHALVNTKEFIFLR